LCPIGFVEVVNQSTVVDSTGSTVAFTIAPFMAVYPNEMSVIANERVHCTRTVDDEWSQCTSDDGTRSGLVPSAYLQYDQPEQPQQLHQQLHQQQQQQQQQRHSGIVDTRRVLYTYATGVPGDLHVQADDYVDILTYIDADWVTARCQSTGEQGLIAYNFLEAVPVSTVRWRQNEPPNTLLHAQFDTIAPLRQTNTAKVSLGQSTRSMSVDHKPSSAWDDVWTEQTKV
jgi:hypothetical protein